MKKLSKNIIILLNLVILFSLFHINNGYTNSFEDIYTIYNVKVTSEDRNSSIARNNAIRIGEQKAFDSLMQKFMLDDVEIEEEDISKLIISYEITKEKISEKGYYAEVNYAFNPNEVRNILKQNKSQYITRKSEKQILVLPTYYSIDPTKFYDNNKLWFQIWRDKTSNTLVNFKLIDSRIKGVASFQDIDKRKYNTLLEISETYATPILLFAEIVENKDLNYLNLYYFDKEKNFFYEDNLPFEGNINENNMEKILHAAVKFAESMSINEDNNIHSVNLEFNIYRTRELVNLKKFLETRDYIKSFKLHNTTYPKATFYIQHNTNNDWLKHEFNNNGYSFKEVNAHYIKERE